MFYFDVQFTQLKDRKMIDLFGENFIIKCLLFYSKSLTSDERKNSIQHRNQKLPSKKTSYINEVIIERKFNDIDKKINF